MFGKVNAAPALCFFVQVLEAYEPPDQEIPPEVEAALTPALAGNTILTV